MRARAPPRLDSGIGDDIAHWRIKAAPYSRIQMSFELLIVHVFENAKEVIDQSIEARQIAALDRFVIGHSAIPEFSHQRISGQPLKKLIECVRHRSHRCESSLARV